MVEVGGGGGTECKSVYFVKVAEQSQEQLYAFPKVCPCLWFLLIWNSQLRQVDTV